MARGKPTWARKRSWPPSLASSLQILSVRVSCQTMALWYGLPVFLSQTTVVSRWLVTPTAAMSAAVAPRFLQAPLITSWVRAQISSGSCSTQPGLGIDLLVLQSGAMPTDSPAWLKIMQRVLVVPWSIAATYLAIFVSPSVIDMISCHIAVTVFCLV